MEKKINEILENFHLGDIDLIQVKNEILILFSDISLKSSVCVCNKPLPFPRQDLVSYYCAKCVKDIKEGKINDKTLNLKQWAKVKGYELTAQKFIKEGKVYDIGHIFAEYIGRE
tara:strand:- start:197 stop:538 length:342 start_codon:yes stop_codon:yes gene_type:complete